VRCKNFRKHAPSFCSHHQPPPRLATVFSSHSHSLAAFWHCDKSFVQTCVQYFLRISFTGVVMAISYRNHLSLSRFILILCLAVSCVDSRSEIVEAARGIAFGVDHVFSLKAPVGWVVDTESAVSSGVGLVFYPVGKTWRNSDVVLYVRGRPKNNEVQTTDQQVEYTLNDFRKNGDPQYRVDSSTERSLPNGKTVKVVFYAGDKWENFEVGGYFEERKTINFLIMNARSKAVFDASLPVFYEILDSYQFVRD
jgi:hypothetical protein